MKDKLLNLILNYRDRVIFETDESLIDVVKRLAIKQVGRKQSYLYIKNKWVFNLTITFEIDTRNKSSFEYSLEQLDFLIETIHSCKSECDSLFNIYSQNK